MNVYLGIDGGGTTTRAVLVEQTGRILGEGCAGSSNYHNCGIRTAAGHIAQAARAAYKQANLSFGCACAAFIGCAGVKARADATRLTMAAESSKIAPVGNIAVANDLHNALAGGLAGKPGIALIAGTGSHALGRDNKGTEASCGGWGWILDDAGGALWLALEALRACAKATDGRCHSTVLLPQALAFLNLSCAEELLEYLHVRGWQPETLAQFAPVVTRAAAEKDAVARSILKEGANALALLVKTLHARLKLGKRPKIVILGSCARSGAPYQPMIERAIVRACPGAQICRPVYAPVYGAAINALRMGGIDPIPKLKIS